MLCLGLFCTKCSQTVLCTLPETINGKRNRAPDTVGLDRTTWRSVVERTTIGPGGSPHTLVCRGILLIKITRPLNGLSLI